MKTAVVFLLVALSCCFDIPAASRTSEKKMHPASSPISKDCIIRLLKSSLPKALIKLQEMLCCFANAEKEKNEELYRQFLTGLHQVLKDCGCTADELLKLQGCLEKVGDELGKICYEIVLQILTCAEDLKLSPVLFDAACQLAGDLLIKLADALEGLNLNIVTDLTSKLSVGGKGQQKNFLGIL